MRVPDLVDLGARPTSPWWVVFWAVLAVGFLIVAITRLSRRSGLPARDEREQVRRVSGSGVKAGIVIAVLALVGVMTWLLWSGMRGDG
jgi:asparagine N-glycosylation enzyme membrane subunit Stt3